MSQRIGAAALLLLLPLSVSAASLNAVTLSLGSGRRVTGRVTFDAKKAAGGGLIFAAPTIGIKDAEAVRLSEAVLVTSGGLSSRAARAARAQSVPAVVLLFAGWHDQTLVVHNPVLGPPQVGPGGGTYEMVIRTEPVTIKEGDIVTIDPLRGTVTAYPPDLQEPALSAAQALKAYDGLKDGQALVHWIEADRRAAAAELLIDDLAERVAAGVAPGSDAARFLRAAYGVLNKDSASKLAVHASTALGRQIRLAQEGLAQSRRSLKEAVTDKAAARLGERARVQAEGLAALADVIKSAATARRAVSDLRALAAQAQARAKTLAKTHPGGFKEAVEAAGAGVPEITVLPGSLYAQWVQENSLAPKLVDAADDASRSLKEKCVRIQDMIVSASLTPESTLGKDILARLKSSGRWLIYGVDEGVEAQTPSEILHAVTRAWASYWNFAQLGARKRAGGPNAPADAAVYARVLFHADVSGIVFSRTTSGAEQITVEAKKGSDNTADAASDEYVLDDAGHTLLSPMFAGSSALLSDAHLKQVVRLARALENHYGYPVAVDFAFVGSRLLALRARPINAEDAR